MIKGVVMNTIKNFLVAVAVLLAGHASAQTDKATTARLVDAKTLVFNATTAMPLANADINAVLSKIPGGQGGNIMLSGGQYQLVIGKDSIEAHLPYYGRAFSPPTRDINDSGIKFKSKDFEYTSKKNKKGNWIISIDPKDTRDVQSMTLTVTQNGYASLHVNSNYRQPISFNGFISEPAKKQASK